MNLTATQTALHFYLFPEFKKKPAFRDEAFRDSLVKMRESFKGSKEWEKYIKLLPASKAQVNRVVRGDDEELGRNGRIKVILREIDKLPFVDIVELCDVALGRRITPAKWTRKRGRPRKG